MKKYFKMPDDKIVELDIFRIKLIEVNNAKKGVTNVIGLK